MEHNSLMSGIRKKKTRREEILADRDLIRGDEDLLQEKRNTNLLVAGATPLLAGLLIGGDMGDSAEIAAKSLGVEQNRHQKQDDSLMSYLMKRDSARAKAESKGSGMAFQKSKSKKGVPLSFNRNSGKYAIASSGEEFKGELYAPSAVPQFVEKQAAATPFKREHALAKEQGKIAGNVYGKFTTEDSEGRKILMSKSDPRIKRQLVDDKGLSPEFKKIREQRYTKLSTRNAEDIKGVRNARKGLRLIRSKGIMPKMVALNMAVKVTENRATDEDRAVVNNHVSRIMRLRESIEQEKNRTVAKRKIEEAQMLFEEIIAISEKTINADIEAGAKAISRTDVEYENAKKFFGDLAPRGLESSESKRLKRIKELEAMGSR